MCAIKLNCTGPDTREVPKKTERCGEKWPGANLCHTSCFREMARGDVEPLFAKRDAAGRLVSFEVPGSGTTCVKM